MRINKKSLCTILLASIMILMSVSVSAEFESYIDLPRTNPAVFPDGTPIAFESYAFNGTQPYLFNWYFCSGCSPQISNTEDPGNVTFPGLGTYKVLFSAQDSSSTPVIINDSVTIRIRLAYLAYPQNNTYWGKNTEIPFDGQGLTSDPSASLTYEWDFGDPIVNTAYASERTKEDPVGVNYTQNGSYHVTFKVTNQNTLESETDDIFLNILEPIGINFSCEVRENNCQGKEIELLRLFRPFNRHVRPPQDPNVGLYTYPLCCKTTSLVQQEATGIGSPAIYASLENNADAFGPETSAPAGGGASINQKIDSASINHYELTSYYGAAPQCQKVKVGANGDCQDYNNMKCVYEFYPGSGLGDLGHVSECTNETTPNSFGEDTWAQCCVIAEDCTNNIDDNKNMWFDCTDADACTVPNYERACGTSDKLEQSPTCSWTNSYCNATGCDFTGYSKPYYDEARQTYGFELFDATHPNCVVYYDNNTASWITENCAPGTDENDVVLPQEVIDQVPIINAEYAPKTTTAYETYFRCRYYYCSAGQDESGRPLPAFSEDMINNGNEARHCCTTGNYWNPNTDNGDGTFGACEQFSECYSPVDFSNKYPCQSDFNTELNNWIDDVYGETNPLHAPEDCVRDDLLASGVTTDTACCPVWSYNENTYQMTDITYYMVQ